MEGIRYAARQVVECLGLAPKERVVVIYDLAASEIAQSIILEAERRSLEGIEAYLMEDYGERSNNGKNPLKLPYKIRDSLTRANVSLFVAGETKPGEFESFRSPMLEVIRLYRVRHTHMPGITKEAFVSGMSIDYHKLRKLTQKVYNLVKDAKEIRVTTPAGSDFKAAFSKNYKWVISDGFSTPEKWTNLPDGETFTAPKNLEGKVVVDGVLGDHFDRSYGLLDLTPLTIYFECGRIKDFNCPGNKDLKKEFETYINSDENANRVGEFAIGTNVGLKRLLGNMVHDEKFPGVHIAVGDPIGEETGAEWTSKVHCDFVMRNCNIFVDDEQIMTNGEFSQNIFSRELS